MTTGTTWIEVTWVNPAGFTLYNDSIVSGPTCGDWTNQTSAGGVVTSYNLTGLLPATTYCIGVIAWDDASPVSNTIQVQTLAAPGGGGGCGSSCGTGTGNGGWTGGQPFPQSVVSPSALWTYLGIGILAGAALLFYLRRPEGLILLAAGVIIITVSIVWPTIL